MYQPFKKPNDTPVYINVNSNHPPNIIKSIPEIISKRISDISSNKDIFKQAAPYYNNALSNSGYKDKISYTKEQERNPKNRGRNIIWFNPPYSTNVKTNVAKTFLLLVDKHFPKNHRLRILFNRNNVKVSYSCLPSIASIITLHNKSIIRNTKDTINPKCNCRVKESCPLDNKCLDTSVVYKCNIKTEDPNKEANYIGLTEGTFKTRYYQHRNTFKYESKANSTVLSKYYWELKNSGSKDISLHWSIVDHANPYVYGSNKCDLCITEKYHIITSSIDLLNKRSELTSKCRHDNKYILKNYKAIPPD